MVVRLTQLDGALPNLALMKLAHWHKSQGHEVHVTRHILPTLFEPSYDAVYGSTIFKFSKERTGMFMQAWPQAAIGGTGTFQDSGLPVLDSRPRDNGRKVEEITGDHEGYDYSGYPDFDASIGFTQRGCRLRCGFCVVPEKEGKPRSVNTIHDIWRGDGHPKHLHILDNDFFGQPKDQWGARIREIVDGKFKVCLSQGINARLIDDEAAAHIAMIDYRGLDFKAKRLYTAWDNLRDEEIFFAGVDRLERAGISPKRLMVYMLVGYDKTETWNRIWYRFKRMTERGVNPYPMVFDKARRDIVCFQRWVITGIYRFVKWPDYERETKTQESIDAWREIYE